MNYRLLGKTGFNISEVSLGTWQVGGKWGEKFDHSNAEKILNSAIDNGINFIDTADVYGDGESEKAVGNVVRSRSEEIFVATKCGRKFSPHINESYTVEALRKCVEYSLANMKLDVIDLIQLHCPPTEVFYRDEIFELFDRLKDEGKIRNLGVSIEKVSEGLQAMKYENVTSIQFIFNMFRQKPIDELFAAVKANNVGLIARVPLASGLLTGKFSETTNFGKDDHRFFNRNGEAFDKGETFSGVDYQLGLEAVNDLKSIFPGQELALVALKWILQFNEISCVIPGASTPAQIENNLKVEQISDLTEDQMQAVKAVYENKIKKYVHHLW
ncbi:aldo/keto reductase [Pseudopedobacter saltans DSM 12145]|uniref:Aldo/keto reductase n=1 Tax=Pseudopedobacter saltans (strain ATCC 51119 / DSM 12145 / JCM 21818 / CCUG 39354 / LMG 10337 / NBRC 100064 / NCIMB 13643) TaxID=762903 RepID=F0S880_PSESL|nr:aldo/keto reductase [Pseudopedobacter saltans]ADY52342.1 aldo/keto reductase [Pseudopedobacter saltans DSM 12145]